VAHCKNSDCASLRNCGTLPCIAWGSKWLASFGEFQVNLESNELLRSGLRVPIQDQPLRVLRLLLEAEGKVVRREQLRTTLWPEDTFVDFEHGVNTAVKKLRQALEDSAERPNYVETLPKVGYRFIPVVEWVSRNGSRPEVVETETPEPVVAPPQSVDQQVPGSSSRWRFAAILFGALLLLAIAGYLRQSPSEGHSDELSVVPLTTFPGLEVAPDFSPDGNQVVFSWFGYEKDFQFDLYIKQVGQERVVQLTHHPAAFLASAWSPDGRFIAFKREAEPEASGIYLISALGGAERKLASIVPFGGPERIAVSWSPDSKWVAFSKTGSPYKKAPTSSDHYSLHLVNIETHEERILPDPAPDCVETLHPAFSPDGKYLATMCAPTESVFRIYVQRPDGTQPREVSSVKSSEGFADLRWAADSQSLIYAAGHQLWRVPLAGGKSERLLFAQDTESVSVARWGNRLAYAQVRHPGSVWQLELSGPTTPAGPAAKLISSSLGEGSARISPNGKHIAFQSSRSGNPEIWMCDRDASNPVQLTSFRGAQVGPPSWSPDSRRIIFDVRASDKPELYVVKTEGGPPTQFVTGTPNASYPFWSADGRSIYFSTEPPGAIWKAPVQGGESVRLTGEAEAGMAPQEALGGKRLYFHKVDTLNHTQAWSVPVTGGKANPVIGMPTDVDFVPGLGGIYFAAGAPRHHSLSRFDLVTRQVQKIADLPSVFTQWGPSLSPDGHSFLFSGIEHSEGDIILVEGFR